MFFSVSFSIVSAKSMASSARCAFSCMLVPMAEQMPTRPRSIWRILLEVIGWLLLLAGLVYAGKTIVDIVEFHHVTTDTLSHAAAALMLVLIGSLVNSAAKRSGRGS